MAPPVSRHDVRSGRFRLDSAAEEFQAPIDIFAVRRDDAGLAIGVQKIPVPLEVEQVVRIQRPQDAFVEPFDHLLDRQVIDPRVEDAALPPGREALGAPL